MLILLFKALHLITAIAWFSGLFYLPRLFVYHADTTDAEGRERFKTMEKRLLKMIMTPAMVATLVFGLTLFALRFATDAALFWVWLKLIVVMMLVGYHFCCAHYVARFAADRNEKSTRFFRFFNEGPTIALILIIVLAVFRPF